LKTDHRTINPALATYSLVSQDRQGHQAELSRLTAPSQQPAIWPLYALGSSRTPNGLE
jgi:hypothetical protein